MLDSNLATYTRQTILRMLDAQRWSLEWRMKELALIHKKIDELTTELAHRDAEVVPERY